MRRENDGKSGLGEPEVRDAPGRVLKVQELEARRRSADDEIRQQSEFLDQVLESLTHPFYVLDARDFTIKIANSASRLGDLSKRPTCFAVTHRRAEPCDGLDHTCPLQQVKKTGQPVTVEHVHYDKDGNARNVEVHAYPIFDEEGTVVRMIEYMLDITERKKLEKELERYAEKTKLFAYSVSHDLKNPIIAIRGLADLLCRRYSETLDDGVRATCGQILRASQHVLTLIEEINAYIRIKERPLDLEMIRPKEVLQEIKDESRAALLDRGILWSEPDHIPEIKAERTSVLRVFRNLVDNALKYGGPDLTEIRIGYTTAGGFHIFSIYDDGTGIDVQSTEKIFEAFQRSHQARGVEGTGLGLAIVKDITEKHGGRAWVESGPNAGVTFYVSISNRL